MKELNIEFIPREKQKSEFDWANIEFNSQQVGKSRCLIKGNELTICTITIYPEYQGNGYGKEFVERAKHKFNKIIADRVKYSAIGFWEKVGFVIIAETGNWMYEKPS
jgi:ribosomal protein S18 acetylase RimI-like enzyme